MSRVKFYYDGEGDFLEVRFGKPTESYCEDVGDDTFVRKDEKSDEVKGFAMYNVKKRMRLELKN